MAKFKNGDILYDTHFNVILKLVDAEEGDCIILNELGQEGEELYGVVSVEYKDCHIASQEEIEKYFDNTIQ